MIAAIRILARLAWTRLWRGRAIWITAVLVILPPAMAWVQLLVRGDPVGRWEMVAETGLRFVVTLGAALHLAPALHEELEGGTWTYLWSRPVPRAAVLLGKLAVVVPLLAAATAASLAAGYLIATGGEAGAHLGLLGRGIAAAAAGALAAGALSVGAGALFPRRPFVFVLGYFLALDQFLDRIPNLAEVSIVYHVRVLAGLPPAHLEPSVPGSAAALGILTAAWLAIGAWRIGRAELATMER